MTRGKPGSRPKLWVVTTVTMTLDVVLRGQPGYLANHLDVTLVASPSPRLAEVGAREGVATIGIPMTRAITPLQDAIAVARLWRLARRARPDVVHSYTPKAGIVAMVGARLAGVPHRIHSVVGLPLTESKGLKQRLLKVVEAVTYRNATHVLANSRELAEHLHALFPRHVFDVINGGTVDGIDGSRFDPALQCRDVRSELGIPSDALVFAYVGRVVRHKGIRELVAAFTEVRSAHPSTYLIVVGELDGAGSPDVSLQRQMRSHAAIRWVGFQDDVRPYLAAADILALPSYREGLPQSVVEAAAMEVPSIVTDISGCREAVVAEETGWLVSPKDAESLRDAMLRALAHRDDLPTMGKAGRIYVLDAFDQSEVRSELLALYLGQVERPELNR